MPQELKDLASRPKTREELRQFLVFHKQLSDRNLVDEIEFVGVDMENVVTTIHYKTSSGEAVLEKESL